MEKPKYLVTGATGATGGAAVAALLDAKADVRALVHREDARAERLRHHGAEMVVGDLLDFDAVRGALEGVAGAYFVYPIAPGIVQATAQFAQAAKEHGVGVVVNMSQISARSDSLSHAARQHWLAERVFDGFDVPTAHLRPTFFAEWVLYYAAMVKSGTIYGPEGRGRQALVAAEDQGRVVAAILLDPAPYVGQTLPLYGAVEKTWNETAESVGRALGRTVRYQQVPFEAFQAGIEPAIRAVRGDADYGFLFQHLREVALDQQGGLFAGTNDVVERITGRAPMTMEVFVEKHREAFA